MNLNDHIKAIEKEFDENVLNDILPPNLDILHTDMDSRSSRQRAKDFLTSKLREIATATLAACEVEREDNICTCDRRVCHCGKFPTGKETNAYNAAISEQKKKAKEWLDTKGKEEVK